MVREWFQVNIHSGRQWVGGVGRLRDVDRLGTLKVYFRRKEAAARWAGYAWALRREKVRVSGRLRLSWSWPARPPTAGPA
jgi:hypothetical protein